MVKLRSSNLSMPLWEVIPSRERLSQAFTSFPSLITPSDTQPRRGYFFATPAQGLSACDQPPSSRPGCGRRRATRWDTTYSVHRLWGTDLHPGGITATRRRSATGPTTQTRPGKMGTKATAMPRQDLPGSPGSLAVTQVRSTSPASNPKPSLYCRDDSRPLIAQGRHFAPHLSLTNYFPKAVLRERGLR